MNHRFHYLLTGLMLLAASVLTAGGLEKYIASGSVLMAELNVKSVVAHKHFEKGLSSGEAREAVAMWTAITGLSPQKDVETVVLFADNKQRGGLLIKIKHHEKLAARLNSPGFAAELDNLSKLIDKKLKFSRGKKDGRDLYYFAEDGDDDDDRIVLTFLEPGILLIASVEDVDRMLKGPRISPAEAALLKRYLPDSSYPFRAVWVNSSFGSGKKNKERGFQDDFKAASFAFKFGSGKNDLDQYYVLKLICANNDQAMMQSMILPGYLQIGVGMVFRNQPQLAEKLLNSIRTSVKDDTVSFSLHITNALYEELLKYAEEMASGSFAAIDPAASDSKSGKK